MSNSRSEQMGFSRSWTGEDKNWSVDSFYGFALCRIEFCEEVSHRGKYSIDFIFLEFDVGANKIISG